MIESRLWLIALTFAQLSVVSVGGVPSIVPAIHHQVVQVFGWMSDAQFARAYAISQVAPGPNMLIVSLVGWRAAGAAGLAVATLACIAPASLLAFAVGRGMARLSGRAWFPRASAALAPVVAGLYMASGLVIARAADRSAAMIVVTAGAAVFMTLTRRNPLWAIAAGATLGVGAALAGFS
ncbi:MAG TPA: chromate transporter [Beijerinckiaceae bacterium]|nr:chromate transporter [Beijerinckiaceae bacterium]